MPPHAAVPAAAPAAGQPDPPTSVAPAKGFATSNDRTEDRTSGWGETGASNRASMTTAHPAGTALPAIPRCTPPREEWRQLENQLTRLYRGYGYDVEPQLDVGLQPSGSRHIVDLAVRVPGCEPLLLVSAKHLKPKSGLGAILLHEVSKLSRTAYDYEVASAVIVCGGDGWTLDLIEDAEAFAAYVKTVGYAKPRFPIRVVWSGHPDPSKHLSIPDARALPGVQTGEVAQLLSLDRAARH